jgi:hypothetical protein
MLPRDGRDAALARIQFAPAICGSVTLDGLVDVDPIWRPLLIALASRIDVSWVTAGVSDRSWFPGTVTVSEKTPPQRIDGELCADPRAEIVEALRWARDLLSSGNAAAADVAIVAASPANWDEHMLVLSRNANLPVHFSHGLPALGTWEGQGCAALADVLVNGLSQDGVRRLLRYAHPMTESLPADWGRRPSPTRGPILGDAVASSAGLDQAEAERTGPDRAGSIANPRITCPRNGACG